MSALDPIVTVTISADGTPLTRQGFGTLLIATAQETLATPTVATYTSPAQAATAEGSLSPIHRAVRAAFAQSPRPSRVKVAKLGVVVATTVDVTVDAATDGTVTSITIYNPDGTSTTHTHTASSDTTTTIATELAATISSESTIVSATGSGAVITITNDANGDLPFYELNSNLSSFDDNTADPGYATRLDALLNVDSDFYGLVVDCNSEAIVDAVAAWTESAGKLFVGCVADARELGASGTIGAGLVSAAYDRTALLCHSKPWQYAGVAWMAANLFDPDQGQRSWAFTTLAGIDVDTLSPTQRGYLDGDKTNFYVTIAGRNAVLSTSTTTPGGGFVASGEWIDIIHGTDWLAQRIQEDVATLIMNAGKLPYTQAGIDQVVATVLKRMRQGEAIGFLAPSSSTVIGPAIADVLSADKQARTLNGVEASAEYAGAIHKTNLSVSLSY